MILLTYTHIGKSVALVDMIPPCWLIQRSCLCYLTLEKNQHTLHIALNKILEP